MLELFGAGVVSLVAGLLVGGVGGAALGAVAAARGVGRLASLRQETRQARDALDALEDEHERLRGAHQELEARRGQLDVETKHLQALVGREVELTGTLQTLTRDAGHARGDLDRSLAELESARERLQGLMGKLDLYSRIDEYVSVGHFDRPEYLYETSERFKLEIDRVRDAQRAMIKQQTAVDLPDRDDIAETKAATRRVLTGQAKLMLRAFNVECDFLIGKVNAGNLPRTLQQIEKVAESIDKTAASLHCGISAAYADLKYQECALQYQYKLRKAEEQEEQRQIKEQMREEAKVRAEYERAEAAAEKQQALYEQLIAKAREEVGRAVEAERGVAEARLRELEAQLAEAIAAKERAKSLAEQTRRGHVYVISNIGSFGPNVYKIGLTRRYDPMDRVKELGDASVPFAFDVHAMIFVEDAPRLENELHRWFAARRVNAVNLRKEFFSVSLEDIQGAAEELVGEDLDFRKTVVAEEYYETRRLLGEGAVSELAVG